jgi:pimeloyl-ACP methyl ester carboxylesterase
MNKNMKLSIILILIVLTCNVSLAQTFQIGHTTITFVDSSRSNRSIPTEIYYPADVAGDNVPVTNAVNDKFPVLSFGHGFVMTWEAYQNIWEAVVEDGFIMAFPKTETGIAPSHADFGKDIVFVIEKLNSLDQDSTSLFFNRIDSMNCVMGHSMGGGAAFLAAQFSPVVKTLATLAPAETNPSAIQAATSSIIPSLIFAGGNDCVTPPATNQLPMYDSLQASCKTYISILGGSHCQMANTNFLCNIGEATCSPTPTISRAVQHTIINRYLLPWLNFQLKNDCVAGSIFDSTIAADSSINFQKTCLLCSSTSSSEIESNFNFELFPNPFKESLMVRLSQSTNKEFLVELYSMNGAKLLTRKVHNSIPNERHKLDLPNNLLKGIYLLKVTSDKEIISKKIVKE